MKVTMGSKVGRDGRRYVGITNRGHKVVFSLVHYKRSRGKLPLSKYDQPLEPMFYIHGTYVHCVQLRLAFKPTFTFTFKSLFA